MEFFEVIENRRSVRSYRKDPVEKEKIRLILKAASMAPSAGNLQAFEVVLISDEKKKAQVARFALNQWFIAEAPAILLFFANPERNVWKYGRRGLELYSLQDATIACAYAQLAATAMGLGTCWVGAFDENGLKQFLGVPGSWKPVSILTIGYPAEEPIRVPKRSVEDFLHVR
ncbi:MAG: nitroreductase family protein [Hydrogenobacter thermophilus]|uniref:nitroreductase family protein n=1 Tax=Hydrogenobacter thermophilus TaxID=940 RepID=UPI001C7822DA|nr:nitroreductase family protein [Hydrogenobacter thermophilus]QWK18988.1 MAG: nitroreductase family protein [Hydrogenobacter thermophilus]